MIAVRPKNTKKGGLIEFFGYPVVDRFVGVCLTFNIIEEGKNPYEVMKNVEEAAFLHLRVVCKKNLSDDLLNRYAPKEFWDKYFEQQKNIAMRRISGLKSMSTKSVKYTPASLSLMGCTL